MTKRLLKQLVEASFTDNTLHAKQVFAIADRLKRSDLKAYIRALRIKNNEKSVTLEIAIMPGKKSIEALKAIFKKKTIRIQTNPDLIAGIKITDNDNIYQMNLKNTLQQLQQYMEESYDR